MSYSSGILNKRIEIARRSDNAESSFGKAGQPQYESLGLFWAAADFSRGTKSLREGAFDAYDIVMFRMRYHACIDRWCIIKYQGKWYQIDTFNADMQGNQIQITATEMSNQQVNIV